MRQGFLSIISIRMTMMVSMLPFLAASAAAQSTPPGAVPLAPSESFKIRRNGQLFTCGLVSGRWLPGRFLKGGTLFYSIAAEIKETKRKIKKAAGVKRRNLQQLLSRLLSRRKSGDAACRGGPGQSGPTPTPTTPGGGSNFDGNGNVTAQGKITFGIPSNLSANAITGQTTWNRLCRGCHASEETNRTFTNYRQATMAPPMSFSITQLPDSDLAHITAYLNRFRL